jgi:hypothetical protein
LKKKDGKINIIIKRNKNEKEERKDKYNNRKKLK